MAKLTKAKKLTKKDLEHLLTTQMSLVEPLYFLRKVGRRWVGSIISSSFKGMRDHKRQNMIWDAVEAELGTKAVTQVGLLLAYTPQEWNWDSDETPVIKAKTKNAG